MSQRMCPYNNCDGSGLLPFTGKDGKIREDVHLFCDCHQQYGIDVHEHTQPLAPSDFDYPMSYDFYRSLCHQHGWPDPGNDSPSQPESVMQPQVVERVIRHSNMGKKEFALLHRLAGEVKYLQNKELRRQSKRNGTY